MDEHARVLNDGRILPPIGFGTWKIEDRDAREAVGAAIRVGYRLIDTASAYGNERGVGAAIRDAQLDPGEVIVTSKIWNDAHGFDAAIRACEASLARLSVSSIDLLLIHWPCPGQGLYVETWKALGRLRYEGRARSIGVSNFTSPQLERIIGETGIVPAVNQIELHPRFQQVDLRRAHARHGIATQGWRPLRHDLLTDPVVRGAAWKHRRSPVQVLLRWQIECDVVPISKTASPTRMAENLAAVDFELDNDDHAALAALDDPAGRTGGDPDQFA